MLHRIQSLTLLKIIEDKVSNLWLNKKGIQSITNINKIDEHNNLLEYQITRMHLNRKQTGITCCRGSNDQFSKAAD